MPHRLPPSCETSRESIITGGPATKAVAGRTKVGVGGGGEVKIAEVEDGELKVKLPSTKL